MSMEKAQAVLNAADPDQVKDASRRQRDRAELDKEDLLVLLSTHAGKRFILKMLNVLRTWDTGCCPPHDMAYREGAREVGLGLLSEILKADPKSYFELARIEKQG